VVEQKIKLCDPIAGIRSTRTPAGLASLARTSRRKKKLTIKVIHSILLKPIQTEPYQHKYKQHGFFCMFGIQSTHLNSSFFSFLTLSDPDIDPLDIEETYVL
jgi:hypothetical protein